MAATTILRTRTRFCPPKIRLHCRLSQKCLEVRHKWLDLMGKLWIFFRADLPERKKRVPSWAEAEKFAKKQFKKIEKIFFNTGQHLETCVFRKNANKGLLLHFQSHVDGTFKRSLLKTMLKRAKRLSSTQDFFLQECKTLKGILLKLKYLKKLIETAINRAKHPRDLNHTPTDNRLRITLPCKDGDSWATSEGRSIILCSKSLQAKKSRNGIKAYASETAECCLRIQM